MNPATIVVLVVVAALLGLAIWSIVRRRRKSGGNPVCGSCPYSGNCAAAGHTGNTCN